MRQRLSFVLFQVLIMTSANSQDPHFSQFYANLLYLNPAFSGSDYCPRVILNYRLKTKPVRVKVFGKIGRVSEVVLQRGTSRIWLVGQSWKSKEQYRQFEEEYKLNLSSPFAGFRPLVIQSDAADYKNPFW